MLFNFNGAVMALMHVLIILNLTKRSHQKFKILLVGKALSWYLQYFLSAMHEYE